ncbi:MAG: glyoxylate/hydroxypyruvate reductase A [Betaproteobacteria bacterium]
MKIVFFSPENNIQPWLDELGKALPHADVWAWDQANATRQADYAVLWAPPAELFVSQKQLKAVFNIGAGVDRVINMPNLPADVPIVRLNDAGMAVQMAEYVCHALIRHTRRFEAYDTHADACTWRREPAIDRQAFPVGIMGLGDIGARVAQAVASFDYPTLGWSRTAKSLPGITSYAGDDALGEFLRRVRVLVCVLPLTPETKGLLNATTLSKLKPDAYLINVARGGHLVENDLLQMLANGQLSGATLDVFREEPLPPQHPFWTHPRITVTPHISAITLLSESVNQISEKIRALELGVSIEGVMQPGRGY